MPECVATKCVVKLNDELLVHKSFVFNERFLAGRLIFRSSTLDELKQDWLDVWLIHAIHLQ